MNVTRQETHATIPARSRYALLLDSLATPVDAS